MKRALIVTLLALSSFAKADVPAAYGMLILFVDGSCKSPVSIIPVGSERINCSQIPYAPYSVSSMRMAGDTTCISIYSNTADFCKIYNGQK